MTKLLKLCWSMILPRKSKPLFFENLNIILIWCYSELCEVLIFFFFSFFFSIFGCILVRICGTRNIILWSFYFKWQEHPQKFDTCLWTNDSKEWFLSCRSSSRKYSDLSRFSGKRLSTTFYLVFCHYLLSSSDYIFNFHVWPYQFPWWHSTMLLFY